jgi:hypothetical protein
MYLFKKVTDLFVTKLLTVKKSAVLAFEDGSTLKIGNTEFSSEIFEDIALLTAGGELANLSGLDSTGNQIDAAVAMDTTEVVTAANVIAAAENGSTFILNSATSIISTLPAKAAGLRFRFIVGPLGVANGQNHTIIVNAANDDTLFGGAVVAGVHVGCSAQATINVVGTSGTTALPGDWIEVFNDGTNWNVNARSTTAGSITFTT